jgi:hypothetical protein
VELDIRQEKSNPALRRAAKQLDVMTTTLKVLKVSKRCNKRKVVISSKQLAVCGLPEGTRVVIEVHQGYFRVREAQDGDRNVRVISYRTYANRIGVEPVLDMRNQKELDAVLGQATHFHATFAHHELIIKPVDNHADIAAKTPTAIAFDLGGKDEQGLYSGVLHAISLIRRKKPAFITIDTATDFSQSREATLFQVQLRRLGYDFYQNDKQQLIAELANITVNSDSQSLDLSAQFPTADDNRAKINQQFDHHSPLSTWGICTAGVDLSSLEQEGFDVPSILSWRPHEARDHRKVTRRLETVCSLTGDTKISQKTLKDPKTGRGIDLICDETGEARLKGEDKSFSDIFCAASNLKTLKNAFNENIFTFELSRISQGIRQHNHLHFSLQCDDLPLSFQKTIVGQ